MDKSPIEIAIGQTNILIEDEVCKAVGKVGIHVNKEELLKALKAYEFVEELTSYIFEYPDDDYMTMECLCRKLFKYGLIDKKDGYYLVADGIKADRKTENYSEKPNNSTISKMEQVVDKFKHFDREDFILLIECQKERIAELLARDEPRCRYATNPSGDAWECSGYHITSCEHQKEDYNPDGSVNIVECGLELEKDEPQTDCAWK